MGETSRYKSNQFVGKYRLFNSEEHLDSVAVLLPQKSSLAKLFNGRYIIRAGTVFPSNDSQARGLILNDYDVTDGDIIGALVYHGVVNEYKLPEKITAEAERALKQIIITKE